MQAVESAPTLPTASGRRLTHRSSRAPGPSPHRQPGGDEEDTCWGAQGSSHGSQDCPGPPPRHVPVRPHTASTSRRTHQLWPTLLEEAQVQTLGQRRRTISGRVLLALRPREALPGPHPVPGSSHPHPAEPRRPFREGAPRPSPLSPSLSHGLTPPPRPHQRTPHHVWSLPGPLSQRGLPRGARTGQEPQREAPPSRPATPTTSSGAVGTFFLPVSKQTC